MTEVVRVPGGTVTGPAFSVVIPAYNAADTLGQALESLLAQTEGSWEALVVEDGSTDDTWLVCTRLAASEPRIRVLRHGDGANHGPSATRDLAIGHATGAFVAFLDADDVLLPCALAAYADAFARFRRAGVVYALVDSFGDGRPPRQIGRGEPGRPTGLLRQLARFNVLATSAVAARRTVLGPEAFPQSIQSQFEDWACWLRLAREWPFVFLAQPVARYRIRPTSLQAGLQRSGVVEAYEAAQADFLRAELGEGNEHERGALAEGLAFRAAAATLQATSALRRGRPADARRWLTAALRIAGGWAALMAVLPLALRERRRIGRGLDPPLSLDPAPEPPQPEVRAG